MTSWLTNNNMSLSVGIQYFSHETPTLCRIKIKEKQKLCGGTKNGLNKG